MNGTVTRKIDFAPEPPHDAADAYAPADRRWRPGAAESPAHEQMHRVSAALNDACSAVFDWLAAHGSACRCQYCRGMGADAERELTGTLWALGLVARLVDGQFVIPRPKPAPDTAGGRRKGRAKAGANLDPKKPR